MEAKRNEQGNRKAKHQGRESSDKIRREVVEKSHGGQGEKGEVLMGREDEASDTLATKTDEDEGANRTRNKYRSHAL